MSLFDAYIEKWSALVVRPELIQCDDAANSIRQIYHFLNLSEPPIIFSSQSDRVLNIFLHSKLIESNEYRWGMRVEPQLSRKQEVKLKHQLGLELSQTFTDELLLRLGSSIRNEIGSELESQLWLALEKSIREKINPNYSKCLRNCINCREWICYACKFDYCITELKVTHNPQLWKIFQDLVTSCDWFVPFTKTCAIGDCSVTQYF